MLALNVFSPYFSNSVKKALHFFVLYKILSLILFISVLSSLSLESLIKDVSSLISFIIASIKSIAKFCVSFWVYSPYLGKVLAIVYFISFKYLESWGYSDNLININNYFICFD